MKRLQDEKIIFQHIKRRKRYTKRLQDEKMILSYIKRRKLYITRLQIEKMTFSISRGERIYHESIGGIILKEDFVIYKNLKVCDKL